MKNLLFFRFTQAIDSVSSSTDTVTLGEFAKHYTGFSDEEHLNIAKALLDGLLDDGKIVEIQEGYYKIK